MYAAELPVTWEDAGEETQEGKKLIYIELAAKVKELVWKAKVRSVWGICTEMIFVIK